MIEQEREAFDVETAVLDELGRLRLAVLREAKASDGVDALRATLRRLFMFELVLPGQSAPDQALALGWDDAGGTGLHRIMRPRRDSACPTEPEAVPSGDVARRRNALIRDDRLAAAGVLSRMLVDRASGLDRRPGFRDTAVALLGGWSVPDRALPDGDDGVAARALRDGARGAGADATPARRAAVGRAALDRGGDPFVRLVALRTYREQLIVGAPDRERSAVIANATRVAHRYPILPRRGPWSHRSGHRGRSGRRGLRRPGDARPLVSPMGGRPVRGGGRSCRVAAAAGSPTRGASP